LPTDASSIGIAATTPDLELPSPTAPSLVKVDQISSKCSIHSETAILPSLHTLEATPPAIGNSDQGCPRCEGLSKDCIISWLDLIESAESGCQACELLIVGSDAYFNTKFIHLRRPESAKIDQSSAAALLRVFLHPSRGTLKVGVGWSDIPGLFDQCEFYTEIHHQASPWTGLKAARTVVRDTKDAFPVLQGWIQQCITTHSACNQDFGALPTRVIGVGKPGEEQPFLYISRGESFPYAALSHCWGSIALLRTMKSNIDDHENGLVWTALSQTFQDAITVTQELGLRYLWIDSICIIQDDSEDWETQAAQMATVYSNARVVLAATDAKDGRGGLLFRSPYQPAKGPFTRMTGTGKFCNVYAVVCAKNAYTSRFSITVR
jgi:hypothetical protein